MINPIATFLGKVLVVSLSGVMAPGPVTTATLATGARSRHGGAWIAIGHGIVEFPLMGLIMLGAGVLLQARAFRIGVGLAGGAMLLLMAGMMLAGLRHVTDLQATAKARNPVVTGILLTGGNPYFLLWWATVGLGLATEGAGLGILAFGLFAVLHWLCDLIWLETLSGASNKGVALMGRKSQQVILVVCSVAMAWFGAWFIVDALRNLHPAAAVISPALSWP